MLNGYSIILNTYNHRLIRLSLNIVVIIFQIERDEAVAKEEANGAKKANLETDDGEKKEQLEREKQEQREQLNRWKVKTLIIKSLIVVHFQMKGFYQTDCM